jgi:hypothetical protein
MMGGQHDNDIFSEQFSGIEFIRLDRAAHKSDIESPGQKPGRRLHRVLAVQHQTQMRETFRNKWTQDRENPDICRREGAYRKITGAAPGSLLRKPASMLDPRENVFRFPQENSAGAGQRNVLTATFEQRHAHCCFELSNLLAE